MIEVADIRKDFPILQRKINGKSLVYLDNAATSQKPVAVIDAMVNFSQSHNANVHRGLHTLAVEATSMFEEARSVVAEFVGANEPAEIIFVRNATEAANLLAYSLADFLESGDKILLTQAEHHSNLVPWQVLARRKGCHLNYWPIEADKKLNLLKLKQLVHHQTKIVSLAHVSNILGAINPIGEIVEMVKKINPQTLVVVDGAQAVPHLPVDLKRLGCDFYFFTGHKMLAPPGIGVLWGKREWLEKILPFETGSEMVLEVDWEKTVWNELPWKFEAGTPNILGAIGLAAAIKYLKRIGMKTIAEHQQKITQYTIFRLSELPDVTIYSCDDWQLQAGIIAFNLAHIHAHDVASILDAEGVAVRSGHHCAQPLLSVLGTAAVVRVSPYFYNDKSDIDRLIDGLKVVKRTFKI